MSKRRGHQEPQSRSAFASRTAFDVLAVESGEETPDEDTPVVEAVEQHAAEPSSPTQNKT